MGKKDWKSVCKNFLLANGTFWPIPITLSVDAGVAKTLRRYSLGTALLHVMAASYGSHPFTIVF